MTKLCVVAVGGNSLTQSTQVGTITEQFANAAKTAVGIVDLLEDGWRVVLTHGNGPQVGNILRRVELSQHEVYPLPLDICVADTQGGIGYMLKQVLYNELRSRGLPAKVVTMVTQVVVDAKDRAFQNPEKPIGSFMNAEQADAKRKIGWELKEDSGRGFRRVVASPKPVEILEIEGIRSVIDAGFITIAVGGGGVPVVRQGREIHGIEAVIDKDRASRVLATMLNADLFLVSTGVDAVQISFGSKDAETLHDVSVSRLEELYEAGEFPAGSMGPKIEAVIGFLKDCPDARAAVTSPGQLRAAAAGTGGTQVKS